jgi:hypothetical protein
MGRLTQDDRDYFGFYGELNIRFDIEREQYVFYETSQPADGISIFATFDEVKEAAIASYAEYKRKALRKIEKAEQRLLSATEDKVYGYNPDGGW